MKNRPSISWFHVTVLLIMISSALTADDQQPLAESLLNAGEKSFVEIFRRFKESGDPSVLTTEIDRKSPSGAGDDAKEVLAKRQAIAAVALFRLNQPEKVWPLLRHSPDPRARSYLIHRLAPQGADPALLIKRLEEEPDISIRRALILCLGQFDLTSLRTSLVPTLKDIYRTANDPGLHSATEWLLQRQGERDWLKQTTREWAKNSEWQKRRESIERSLTNAAQRPGPQWYVNSQRQTMVVFAGPVEFQMGTPVTEHRMRIGRTFAIANKSVTLEQFDACDVGNNPDDLYRYDDNDNFYLYKDRIAGLSEDMPVIGTTWNQAAMYCNWLSRQESYPEVYEIKGQIIRMKENGLQLAGYRLPTEAEMEYVTRAGSATSRFYGESEELLPSYAHYWRPKARRGPIFVGSKMPNEFGLFDVFGNVFNWCQDPYFEIPPAVADDEKVELGPAAVEEQPQSLRVLRGGSCYSLPNFLRSPTRYGKLPLTRKPDIGFRVARTLPVVSSSS